MIFTSPRGTRAYVLFGFYTRDLITGGVFIPSRFRRMFMEYRDNAAAASDWTACYADTKRALHTYVRGRYWGADICNNMKFFLFILFLCYHSPPMIWNEKLRISALNTTLVYKPCVRKLNAFVCVYVYFGAVCWEHNKHDKFSFFISFSKKVNF